jgi:hypothetical protein
MAMPSFRNLFPIPRIDKNGRITIRHMRNDKNTAPASRNALPAVSIGTPMPTAEDRAKSLWEAIAPLNERFSSEEYFTKDFVNLMEKYPRLAATTERTFTTGTERARKLAMHIAGHFLTLLRQPVAAHEDFEDTFNKQLLERWNAFNVGEETGLCDTLSLNTPSRVISIPEEVKDRFDDVGWRGYAAFRLAFEVPGSRGSDGNLMEFIYWAGQQNDLRTVIELARERGTMAPKVLQPLMEAARDNPSGVLRDGLL